MSGVDERWLHFAREDLQVAELAFDAGLWGPVGFHAQQCVEKLLKGLLAGRGEAPPRVHDLEDLLDRVGRSSFGKLGDEIADLSRFYMPTRYPDLGPAVEVGPPSEEEASEALALARRALDIATGAAE